MTNDNRSLEKKSPNRQKHSRRMLYFFIALLAAPFAAIAIMALTLDYGYGFMAGVYYDTYTNMLIAEALLRMLSVGHVVSVVLMSSRYIRGPAVRVISLTVVIAAVLIVADIYASILFMAYSAGPG